MQQPKFTWWPWRLIALALPLFAAANTLIASRDTQNDMQLALVFCGVLGAGNGFLVATAIGDFGRAALSVPIGAMVAFLVVLSMYVPALRVLGGVLLATALIGYAISQFYARTFTSLLMIGLTVFVFVPACLGSLNDRGGAWVWMCYPLITALICSTMPLHRTIGGVVTAGMAGLVASFWGMIYGLLSFLVLLIPAGVLVSMLRPSQYREIPIVGAALIGLAFANYICIRVLFDAAVRVDVGADHERVRETPTYVRPAELAPEADAVMLCNPRPIEGDLEPVGNGVKSPPGEAPAQG